MKKLLIAAVFVVLAALTETPDDHVLTRGIDADQYQSYAAAWAKAESRGAVSADQDEALSEVQADQARFDAELHPAAI